MNSNLPNVADSLYTISEASRILGVHPSTLRLWESQGLISPQRTPGGNRRYLFSDLQRLLSRKADERRKFDGRFKPEEPPVDSPTVPVRSLESYQPRPRYLLNKLAVLTLGILVSFAFWQQTPELTKERWERAFSLGVLNPIVDVNDALEYRIADNRVEGLRSKFPFLTDFLRVTQSALLNSARFLGTVFFGEGNNYFVSPTGDASFNSVTSNEGEVSELTVTNLTVTGTSTGTQGEGAGGGPSQGGDADTLEGQSGSYYLDLDNEVGTCTNCLTSTEIEESTLFGVGSAQEADHATSADTSTTANNANNLDGLDSSQFLRSDTSDSYTSGTLTFNAGTTLDISGLLALPSSGISGAGSGSGLDADLLDGQQGTYFLDLDNQTGTCSNCLSTTEIDESTFAGLNASNIDDIYLFNTGDTATGTYTFQDDVTLGLTSADTLIVNSRVASDIIPIDNTQTLGSASLRWDIGYFDEIVVNSLSADAVDAGGTISSDWTINSDNATNDLEDSTITFERGTPVQNGVLRWDSANDQYLFEVFPLALDGQLISEVTTGTAPFSVASTTLVSNLNVEYLNSLVSDDFLRSNTSDSYTSGTLIFNAGTILDINGDFSIADTSIALDGTSTDLLVTGDFSINTDDFFIDKATGTVGIGSTPATGATLTVAGSIETTRGANDMVLWSDNVADAQSLISTGSVSSSPITFAAVLENGSNDVALIGQYSWSGGGFRGMRIGPETYSAEFGQFYEEPAFGLDGGSVGLANGGTGVRTRDGSNRFYAFGTDAVRTDSDSLRMGFAPPSNVDAVCSDTGGDLVAGTYYFSVSVVGTQVWWQDSCTVTTGSTGSASISWTASPAATSFHVWKGTSAWTFTLRKSASSSPFSWTTDTGATSTSPPQTNTTTALRLSSDDNSFFNTGYNFAFNSATFTPHSNVSIYTDKDSADDSTLDDFALTILNPANDTGEEVGIGFRISSDHNAGDRPGGALTFERTAGGSNGNLHFKTKGTDGLFTRMSILADGNIGIGTVSPAAKLHIARDDSSTNTQIEISRYERTTTGTAAGGIGQYLSFYNETANGSLMEAGRLQFDSHIVNNGSSGDAANNNASRFRIYAERQTFDDMMPIVGGYATGGDRFLCMNGIENTGVSSWDCFGMAIGSANAMNLSFDGTTRASFNYDSAATQLEIMAVNGADDLELKTLGSQPISFDAANNGADLYITSGGNVGVGTITPESRMQVTGGGLCVGSDANCNTDNNTEGVVYSAATAMTVYDVAENYPTKDATLGPEEIVALDPTNEVFVRRANGNSSDLLLGVISADPAVHLGGFNGSQFKEERQVAVGLSGRIPVKVVTEGGEIAVGDPLVISSIPGVAKKATNSGRVIGYALEGYQNPNPSSVGSIQFFINPGWYDPGLVVDSSGGAAQSNPDGSTTEISSSVITAEEGIFEKLTATILGTFEKLIVQSAIIANALVQELNAVFIRVDELQAGKVSVTSPAVGTISIPKGEVTFLVEYEDIRMDSKVFLTPESPVNVGVVIEEDGGFEVRLAAPLDFDLNVSYWVIN